MRQEHWHGGNTSLRRTSGTVDAGLRAYMRAFSVPLVALAALGAGLILVVGFAG